MKLWKYLVLALCLAALLPAALAEGDVAINEANFPDAAFRKIVKSYDKDYNDVLDAQEIGSVTRIDCYNASIASLKGVEVFTALRELNCLGNALTTLDVSKNVRLTTLTCSFNALTALDVSANVALTGLRCGNNQLTSLDLSRNTALTLVSCESNLLKSLDVSRNGRLSSLMCSENQLTALDVSSNAALAYLYCGQNQLTALDVTQNAALQTLLCDRNQLESLDLSKNPRLMTLMCDWNRLTRLDLSQNPHIAVSSTVGPQRDVEVEVRDGVVDLSGFPDFEPERIKALVGGAWTDGKLVPKSGATEITYRYDCLDDESANTPILMECKLVLAYARKAALTEAYFPDVHFREILYAYDDNADMWLDELEIKKITQLSCASRSVASLKGVEYLAALTSLDCSGNSLAALDVSRNAALEKLLCYENRLTALDVTRNSALTELQCAGNRLTTLDVSRNPALTYIACLKNQLTTLDVTKNPMLEVLYCGDNRLTALDVSGNPVLRWLYCENNRIASLDVTGNPKLQNLYFEGNLLTKLDASKNPDLEFLNCGENRLVALDLSANKKLKGCYLSRNAREITVKTGELDLGDLSGLDTTRIVDLAGASIVNGRLVRDFGANVIEYNYLCNANDASRKLYVALELNYVDGVSISAANFPDPAFREIVRGFDLDGSGGLTEPELAKVTTISAAEKGIKSLKGVEHFAALEALFCEKNKLAALDVSKNAELDTLNCANNKLTALDVSKNAKLLVLACEGNQLTALDVTKNPELVGIDFSDNRLTAISLLWNPRLGTLLCDNNRLEALSLYRNARLNTLRCAGNRLKRLSLSGNPQLKTLDCSGNPLFALDLSGNKRLENWSVDPGALYADITGGAVALSRLPDVDSARITSVTGGKLSDGTLVPNSGAEKLSYVYSCGVRDVGGADIVMKCKVNLIYGEVGRFELPKQLRRVESGAFAKVNTAEFTLPANLETIAPDAFPAGARLYCPEGSVTARCFEENPGVYPLAEPYIP